MGIRVLLGKGRLNLKGIKNKIIFNYCIIIFITVFVLESLFILYARNYYYDFTENFLLNKAKASLDLYNKYMLYSPFEEKVSHIYRNLILKEEAVQIQVIDNKKILILDSYGFHTEEKINTLDVQKALKGDIGVFKGKEGSKNENILAVSIPLKYYQRIEGVLRYSISLEKIKNTIKKIQMVTFIASIGVVSFVLIVSLILARSIVEPIRGLQKSAKEMAKGNYTVRNKEISNDEVGELAQTFNYMAEQIENSARIKNEFISSISHELRTPLTSIKGWSETLAYGRDKEELDIGLKIIQGETDRLIKLVEELLDFSKYQGGKMEIELETIDIEKFLQDVVNQFRVKAREKNIDLSLEIFNELEEIKGDKSRLKQVLINIIENSLKFTKKGGNIKIKGAKYEDFVSIEIEDDGEGIEKENISKVKEKFYQEDSNKPGSGLGLSISNEIVKLHGGQMDIESEKGKGTKVIVRI